LPAPFSASIKECEKRPQIGSFSDHTQKVSFTIELLSNKRRIFTDLHGCGNLIRWHACKAAEKDLDYCINAGQLGD
jgi:hypothetical protein